MSEGPLASADARFVVEVALDATAMHGRDGYRTGVRPNHRMPGRDYTFIGQLDFQDREWLRPGETCLATARLLVADQDLARFHPGFRWAIAEGPKVVGHCILIGPTS